MHTGGGKGERGGREGRQREGMQSTMRTRVPENLLFPTIMLEPPLEPAPGACSGCIESVHSDYKVP